jgi:4,4'-diaponeurosporenoate glycosyltransferase
MLALGVLALLAGVILMRRAPPGLPRYSGFAPRISVVVPARNEEQNLPQLLGSIRASDLTPHELVVVDDASTDATAEVAAAMGATVVSARQLPSGWTGKTWACAQGAEVTHGEFLLFLDADTWFAPQGFERLCAALNPDRGYQPHLTALSLMPYHVTERLYEELSLFFSLLMAFGAGGFGVLGAPRLFGQSLLISRSLYGRIGGHGAVRGAILENFAMAKSIEASGGRCVCLGGRGVFHVRMFPEGPAQMWQSWTKAFADGAAASDPRILAIAVFWLAALCAIALGVLFIHGPERSVAVLVYIIAAAQIGWFARQVGSFRWFTCALYPIPLIFFFSLFSNSLLRRVFRRQVTWRGRRL